MRRFYNKIKNLKDKLKKIKEDKRRKEEESEGRELNYKLEKFFKILYIKILLIINLIDWKNKRKKFKGIN